MTGDVSSGLMVSICHQAAKIRWSQRLPKAKYFSQALCGRWHFAFKPHAVAQINLFLEMCLEADFQPRMRPQEIFSGVYRPQNI
jgi:hypothetical protein